MFVLIAAILIKKTLLKGKHDFLKVLMCGAVISFTFFISFKFDYADTYEVSLPVIAL